MLQPSTDDSDESSIAASSELQRSTNGSASGEAHCNSDAKPKVRALEYAFIPMPPNSSCGERDDGGKILADSGWGEGARDIPSISEGHESHNDIRNNWKPSGASVSGCYNSPPLTRDLDPRSYNMKGERKRGHNTPVNWISEERP
ncbi:hypothetical protein ZWY2020_043497 [Hordeum vulgare]|nr:hypothetical protein ZWY2020_043497 [Hordeum vulgare]